MRKQDRLSEVFRTIEMAYLIASMFAVPLLTVVYKDWLAAFFGVQFIMFQFGLYWWRREAWKAQDKLPSTQEPHE